MKEILKSLPSLPGVYLFKDAAHEIIYVGKAKSIKKRVSSYFRNKDDDWKIKSLLQEFTRIDHIVTKSESEALLLEAQLISKHQPKFNVLLKSGQPFVYLLFTNPKKGVPALEIVRNRKKKGTYFGPFMYKKQARAVYGYLLRTFRLEHCKTKIPSGCLRYHIGMCSGSCLESFDVSHYTFRMHLAQQVLRGNYNDSLKSLQHQIKEYNKQFAFEAAAQLNDYMQHLDAIFAALKDRFSEKKYAQEVFIATSPVYKRTEPDHALAQEIQQFLNLSVAPQTIDCFDISHFQSSEIVGSCIRFAQGVPDKNNFRHFTIRTLTEQNDYAALQEVVKRRYADNTNIPDLIVIDGGKGQLNAVKQILPDANIVSLAKREERMFSASHPDGILLEQKNKVGLFFTGLRDYAHHFAISHHRTRRKNQGFERYL
jgi:excinuclease ABC subunit C